nr:alpha/beta fold hydrolase [Tateyamaria sp. syn59]
MSHSVVLPSGRATYLEAGSEHRDTVLLLHGGGLDCAHLSWRLLLPELAVHYRVIAPNWPGYGGTDPFDGPYQIGDLGRWLMTFLDHLEVQQACMIGVSMGGGAAIWSAIHRSERVTALLPVATFGVAERAPYHRLTYLLTKLPLNAVSYVLLRRSPRLLRRSVEALFARPDRVTPELIAEVAEVLKAAGNGAAFTNFQRGETGATRLRSVFSDRLADVVQPTLFIHGAQDQLVPLEAVKRAADRVTSARLEVMDAGHWPMRERPEQFNELVMAFLRDIQQPS